MRHAPLSTLIVSVIWISAAFLVSAPLRANSDSACHVDAAMSARNSAHEKYKATAAHDDAEAYVVATLMASSAYMDCATSWIGRSKLNQGFAELQAGNLAFEAAQDEHALGDDASTDLEYAWQDLTEAVADIPASATKLLAQAKQRLAEVEHFKSSLTSQ